MKILLLGNYLPDRQESMLRFAQILQTGLTQRGHEVRLVQPQPIFGKLKLSSFGLVKWLGYIDKFLLFPQQLCQAIAWADVVHICDHSNAMYAKYLENVPHLVTCHDLLAVRGALGDDTDCPASMTGKVLQNWILKSLQKSQMVVCVSSSTKHDLEKLIENSLFTKKIRLVLNGLNYSYKQIYRDEVDSRLANIIELDLSKPFILNVGSSLKRKNRDGIMRIFSKIKEQWDGQLIFAGEALTTEQIQLAEQLNIKEQIIQIIKPDNNLLEALYNRAFVFLFPSKCEGFGWPVIEAQACGCPVICSDRTSLPEVVGDSALMRSIEDESGFAEDILRLVDPVERHLWIQKGLNNIKRFTLDEMIDQYNQLYIELVKYK
ncbi:glycosyltransferase family 4 protein [Chroogloeocystis siderophila]|uniref:Glycosyl transferase group 1 n=1 Tax=Chroogloeocystis siderophila 5.2 s.c.1 TaxID=247279 RepID=A0A1U7HGI0_9CHRO|nr:glycosyltransferase family 1 protein [Chroogloeocystis siderophila]OKH22664.1 glycosyl transferase group 1 [Chroogloeocystis siderophila 5.2 s.c.1]